MKLSSLMENIGFANPPMKGASDDMSIAGLSLDSRQVMAGSLFAALKGESVDGRDFIASAIDNGAEAILLASGSDIDSELAQKALFLEHDNPRLALAKMAGRFYAPHPAQLVAVTGTNGKTSVASFVKQVWQALGHNAASMGTMGVESKKINKAGGLTTPDTIEFHKNMQELAGAGVDHVIFEASSHGLQQHRMDGVEISIAAFTNLTHEHLDYHGDIESYFEAKSRLFVDLLEPNGVAVVNIDSHWGNMLAQLCGANNKNLFSIGTSEDATLRLENCQQIDHGYQGEVQFDGGTYAFNLPLMGEFQVENALLAAGIILAQGADANTVFTALSCLEGVAGRMELAGQCADGGKVFIDYAHTPDGLENALGSLQNVRSDGRLLVVFGCGGNRDKAKRPLMGAIATRLADKVFITDDNPRNEDPAIIRSEILSSAPDALEFDDRAAAIHAAVVELNSKDILLVTGKGHEQGQIIGDETLPFSDLATVKAAVLADNKGVQL